MLRNTTAPDMDIVRGTGEDPRFAQDVAMADPGPQSEVPHALMRLEQANAQLHEVVKVLHERLAPIRNERPQKEGDERNKAVRGYGSEVARIIGGQADKAEIASQVIIKILNEIEV